MRFNKMIHPTAIIHPSAEISNNAEVGHYSIIGQNVRIGHQTRIGSHAVIEFADIGNNCQIYSHAFIGTAPQDLKYQGEETKIMIGDGTIVRECATLNRGTAWSGKTQIGKKCLLMAYSHVAHDCVIEDEVILANSVAVAGHVQIGYGAVIGGLSGIHQFVKIGKLAMVGAGAMVPLDVPPFCTVWGDRAKIVGLNTEGMRRRHISKPTIEKIKKIYRDIFFNKKPLKQAIKQMESKIFQTRGIVGKRENFPEEIKEFMHFIKSSTRGICRPRFKTETGAAETW